MENARGLMSTIERSLIRMNTDANGIQLFWGPRCKIRKLWEASQKVVSVLKRPDRRSFTELNQHEHEDDAAHPDSIGLLEGGPEHEDDHETDMPSTSSHERRGSSSNRKYSYSNSDVRLSVDVHHGGVASQLHLSDKHLLSTIQLVGITFFMVAGVSNYNSIPTNIHIQCKMDCIYTGCFEMKCYRKPIHTGVMIYSHPH
jgi:hypothetical protein